jgi:LmbE family N-acetylglucosaminyl deacetylase
MVVVSPHLDDGVFSCGARLCDAPPTSPRTVVTVFAGFPRDRALRTEWDVRCGFANAGEAIATRRVEDRRALAIVDAAPVWLDFPEAQYGGGASADDLVCAIGAALDALRPQTVLFPLGLFHSDHALVHDACVRALRARRHIEPLAYEDALYRRLEGLLQGRLALLAGAGITATPSRRAGGVPGPRKAAAVAAYASQLRGFGPGGYDDTTRPERDWRVDFGASRP